jgi:hypothetical protein
MLQNGCLSSENLKEETENSLTYYHRPVPDIHTMFLVLLTSARYY